jgi:fatty-acyl-CoA synthase
MGPTGSRRGGHGGRDSRFLPGKIAYFKVPQYVRFVDSFPQTVTKKVQKFLMREQEIRERGLEELARQVTA